jgi:carbohydrate-selective porin OprB
MHRTTLLVVCLGAGVTAWAQEEGAGLRRRFEENGVTAGAAYITEGFTDGRAGAALGNLTARLELDLRRLHFFRGQVFTSVQALHGSGVNDRLVGAAQCPSNLEDHPFRKWGEVWYADAYAGGKARVRAGRQYADRDFGVVEASADFLNAAFGALPTAPMPTYPDPHLGAAAWIAPSSAVSLGAGAYAGGFDVFETRTRPFARDTVAFGIWRKDGDHGMYATAEHRFTSDAGPPCAVFARWGHAQADLESYAAAGIVYANAGLGVTAVGPAGKPREVVGELFYKRRVGGRFSIQPDAQYIANPTGNAARRPVWVAGIRLTIEL